MLGYDQLDSKIIAQLRRKECTANDLSTKIKVSRRTIAYRLVRMKKARIVTSRSSSVSSAHIWSLSVQSTQTKSPLSIYWGHDMVRAYALLGTLPPRTIVYSVEGMDFLAQHLRRLPSNFHIQIQTAYIRKKTIIKSIIHEDALKVCDDKDIDFLDVHRRRMSITVLRRRRESLLGPGALIVTPTMLFVFNEEKRYAVVMRDPSVARMLHECLQELLDVLEHVRDLEPTHMGKYISELIKQRGGQ